MLFSIMWFERAFGITFWQYLWNLISSSYSLFEKLCKVKSSHFSFLECLKFFFFFLNTKTRNISVLLFDNCLSPAYYMKKVKVLVTHSCPALCDPMDCSLPGFSVRGIFQARILEWVAILFFRGSSQPRDRTPGLLHCRDILYYLSHQENSAYCMYILS